MAAWSADDQRRYRYNSFLLLPGEKKIEKEVDTRVPNCIIFTFNKEDHTLGNLIHRTLLKFDSVLYTGYMVQHPNVPVVKLRIQTDGTITPEQALVKACEKNVMDLATLSREFQKEWELKMLANATAGTSGAGGADGANNA